MRKELIAALAAAFVLGIGAATLPPVDAFAAGDDRKEASACAKITDKKAKAACFKTEAMTRYRNEAAACDKIKDKRKKAKCLRSEAQAKKKQGKK